MELFRILIAGFGLVATANAQFSITGPGDTIPAGGLNTGSSVGWDVLNLDHAFILTDAPAASTLNVSLPVTRIDSIEIKGLFHTRMGDLQCVLVDPNNLGYNIFLRSDLSEGSLCCGNSDDFLGLDYLFVEPGTSGNGPIPTSGDAVFGEYDQSWETNAVTNLVWPSGDESVFNVPLSGIAGPAGPWTLYIYDWNSGETGSFTGWTLKGNSDGPGIQYCPGDGIYAPCPCGNVNDGSMGGCAWSFDPGFSTGGQLTAIGSNISTNNDTFLIATDINIDFGIFFGANNQLSTTVFDGLRCAGGNLNQFGVELPVSSTFMHSTPLQTRDPFALPGVTRRYQYWFRTNPQVCGFSANTTNAYEIAWM